MDSGAIVYILFFLVVAVIQGIGQKKKEEAKKRAAQGLGEPEPGPSMEVDQGPGQGRGEMKRPSPTARGKESSEGFVPEEVWEEILGLARGQTKPPPPSQPSPSQIRAQDTRQGTLAAEEVPFDPTPRPVPPSRDGQVAPGRQLVEVGQSGGSSAAVEAYSRPAAKLHPPSVPREARPENAHRGIGEDLFADGSVEELRRAIILQEVLGPPLALRDEER